MDSKYVKLQVLAWYHAPVKHLEGLNEEQKRAVLTLSGPLLIVAGAGAGKTKTITHRIAHLIATGVPARSILAVTFTNKAAGEMRERTFRLLGERANSPYGHGPLITTFHSLGVRLLREFYEEAAIPRAFNIWDKDDSARALKRILASLGFDRFTPRQVLSRISREKGNGVEAEYFSENARSSYEEAVARAWIAYEKAREDEGALDFDDLLLRTLSLLKTKADVLGKLHHRWQHITIDEYQDTNRAQYEIARLLAGESRNICVVGDIDQNIYSWRGADIAHLLTFEKTFPGAATILLEHNYRSTQTILTAANAVIAKNVRRYDKKLRTDNPTGEAITLFSARSEREEAAYIAQSIRELLGSGVLAAEIAVLFRENFQSRALEEAMIALGIPYRVLGTRFFERAEVKDVLAYLRAAMNPRSRIDFARAVASPSRGIGKTTIEKIAEGNEEALGAAARAKVAGFRALLVTIKNVIETHRASDAVQMTIALSGLEKMLGEHDEEGRLQNVAELAAHAERYDALAPPEGIERLLEDAALMSDQDALEKKMDAVSLMTVHASKGLEFDAVFITGLEQGLFPSERESDGDRDDEEERRLFYVALTRARKYLFLTLAGSRLKYGSREFTIPSSFLEDIDPRLLSYAETDSFEHIIR